jgi:hypothetical protein
MDNVGSNNPTPNRTDSIPLEGAAGQPARPETAPAAGAPNVSRAPLNLGGTGAPVAPAAPKPPVAPAAPKPPVVRPAPPKLPVAVAAGERITTVKMFFTKLHPGAIKFLEDQITAWLKENPGIVIKRADVTTGEITEKKSEPSLIILVWY